MEEFKKLLGNRVYLEMPKKEDAKIIVDHNTKEALQKELMKTMRRLKVVAVGESVTNIIEGAEVLVDPKALANAVTVPLSDDLEVILVSYFDIMHIW